MVVSFGTSFNDNRRFTVGAIENAMEKAFPDYSVRRGFTSQIIIDHVKSRDNVTIDNVGEALGRAADNGVKNLVIQPTHLMNGLEYNDLVNEVAEYSDAFEKVAVGEPLLTSDDDFKAVMKAVTEATAEYDDGETAICFMGHGTEAESNQVYAKMQDMLKEAGHENYYIGTVEAAKAGEEDFIPYRETEDGLHTFQVPVEALDMGIDCSAFSKKKEKWYDRVLVFRADSLPADAIADGKITTVESLALKDGIYTAEVTLGGGSGRASVESPARLRVENGQAFATIIWGSANYDYMKVDDVKYETVNAEGNSAFEIPVTGFDWKIPVIADTIAMSEPHEIDYTLAFDSSTIKKAE